MPIWNGALEICEVDEADGGTSPNLLIETFGGLPVSLVDLHGGLLAT